jgi:hypothetical protein
MDCRQAPCAVSNLFIQFNITNVYHLFSCMEHALHLAAKHFIEDVSPTLASILNKKMTDDNDNDNDDDEMTEFKVANTVGKALAFITQVNLANRLTRPTLLMKYLFT